VQRPHRAVAETKEDQVTISRTTQRVGVIIGTISVAIALAAPIQASSSKPIGMSKAEHRALMLRSEALNKRYHLGTYSRAAQGTTAPEYRALMIRSEALNKKYHLGSWAVAPASASMSTAGDFSWSAFGIGAAVMLGVVLLASAGIVGGRYGRRVPRTRVSS
jgi:hypothetical protein